MNIQLIARFPSTHPTFHRLEELSPATVRFNQNHELKRSFRSLGSPQTSYVAWGRLGLLCGLLDSFSDYPIDGEVVVSIDRGSFSVSGKIELYDPSRQLPIWESLMAAERVAQELSEDSDVTSFRLKLTQHIIEMQAGNEVD